MAKLAFVQEAFGEKDERGRTINASRVSVKTGISRKEVRRIRELREKTGPGGKALRFDYSAAPGIVLQRWHSDPQYLDSYGMPRPLPLNDPSSSFTGLVRSVAGDIPHGAIRAELKQAGAIEESDDGLVRVLKRYYVPGDFDEKALTVIPTMLFSMAAGLEHNSNPRRRTEGFIQRFAFSESLDPASVETFRHWARVQATDFIESMDNWLSANERPASSNVDGRKRERAGIGVFYYEGPSAEDSAAAND
jgi:hypothetical protein